MIGSAFYGQMKQKLTGWDQMGANGSGKWPVIGFSGIIYNRPLNMAAEVSWCGVVCLHMVLATWFASMDE
jgi:hypothetical protein